MSETFVFTVGGTVQASAGIYIRRKADQQLLEACQNGKYAYILSARQVGKSSLTVDVARELRQYGMLTATVDLAGIGGEKVDAESWYLGILYEIERKLGSGRDVFTWWDQHPRLTLSARFISYFRDVILAQVSGRLIVFLDEIDTTLGLKFTDDFFAAIRMMYNVRAEEPELARLSFVFIGVAVPTDLIKNPKRSPFNIAVPIDLLDFNLDEARPLAAGLPVPGERRDLILNRVLYWTGGHPYLTQKLLHVISQEDRVASDIHDVDAVVERTFLGDRSTSDSNLENAERRLSGESPLSYRMLRIYQRVLGGIPVRDIDHNLAKSYLKLSGVVKRKNGFLVVRNRIYERVFDAAWVEEQRAIRQERAARNALIAAGFLLLVALGLGIYSIIQRHEAEENRKDAEQQKVLTNKAQASEARAKESLAEEQKAKAEAEHQKEIAERQTKIAVQKTEEASRFAEAAGRAASEQTRLAKEAKKSADQAAESAKQAEQARDQAEKNLLAAQHAKQEADLQREIAQKNFTAAQAAIRGETEKARQLLGLKLVPDSDLLRLQQPDRTEDGMLLDIEAYRRNPGIETQQALRSGLDKLLPRIGYISAGGDPSSVALSPDGTILAIAEPNGTVRSYGLPGMHPGGTLDAVKPSFLAVTSNGITAGNPSGPVHRPDRSDLPLEKETLVAVGQDGLRFATISPDKKTVRYWQNDQAVGVAKHSSRVILAQFRGVSLDTFTENRDFAEWSPISGGKFRRLTQFQLPNEVGAPEFFGYYRRGASEGVALASGATVRIFSAQPGYKRGHTALVLPGLRLTINTLQYAILRHDATITALAVDPKNRFIATASRDRTVRLWNLATGLEITRIRLADPVVKMVLSSDGRSLAAVGSAGMVSVFSTEPGAAVARTDSGSFWGISFLADNSIALLAGPSGTNTLLNLPAAQPEDQIWDWQRDTTQAVLSATNPRLSAVLSTAGPYRLELSSNSSNSLENSVRQVNNVTKRLPAGKQAGAFSPMPNIAVFSSLLGAVYHAAIPDAAGPLALSPDGHWAALLSGGGLYLQDFAGNKLDPGFTNDKSASFNAIAVSSNGPAVAVLSSGTVRLWTAGKGTLQIPESGVNGIAFSPDGKLFATTGPAETVIFDRDGKSVQRIPRSAISAIVFSPDDQYVAGVVGGTAHIWQTTTGREIATFPGISDSVSRVAFSADGRHLATTTSDGTRVWIWQPEDLVAEACRRVSKPQLEKEVWDKYLPGETPQSTCPVP